MCAGGVDGFLVRVLHCSSDTERQTQSTFSYILPPTLCRSSITLDGDALATLRLDPIRLEGLGKKSVHFLSSFDPSEKSVLARQQVHIEQQH